MALISDAHIERPSPLPFEPLPPPLTIPGHLLNHPSWNTIVLSQETLDTLAGIVGEREIISDPEELIVYECDGYTLEKDSPIAVVFPRSIEHVVQIVRCLHKKKIPFLARGAGTGLSGGCIPTQGGVIIGMNKMNQILEIDYRNRRVVVEPGVVNLWITNAVSPKGYLYAPDPSSQMSCTIGGNVAENSGGPHTLKYGVTTNHTLGLEFVLPNGDLIDVGGKAEDMPGYDLTGLMVGSEGTFGICTKAIIRIIRRPQTYRTMLGVFESVDDATQTVSDIIAAGILPAALEMMDQLIIKAVEDAFHFGFPLDAKAVLIMELDGLEAGIDGQASRIMEICRQNNAREVSQAATDEERMALWASRKKAFGAMGRLAPNYCTQDGVIPRTKLPGMLRFISKLSEKYDVRIANVFHAGDGNLHPILLYDERDADLVRRTLKASGEILDECIRLGGSVTGEHGIGIEKISYMPKMFSPEDISVMAALKKIFNPEDLLNPHKIFPDSRICMEPRMLKKQVPA
ncbi:MAG: FAD-binding protein [Planctomycetota bacterium]|nr:FAD-binding protein [Planctomycetota bacterium]